MKSQANWSLIDHKKLFLKTATGESSPAHSSVQITITIPSTVIEGKFLVADIYDDRILELDLMRKDDLIINQQNRVLRAPYDDCSQLEELP